MTLSRRDDQDDIKIKQPKMMTISVVLNHRDFEKFFLPRIEVFYKLQNFKISPRIRLVLFVEFSQLKIINNETQANQDIFLIF